MQRRAPLRRQVGLAPSGGLERRAALRKRAPSRYWDDALAKVARLDRCACGCGLPGRLDAAHIIGRRYDLPCDAYGRAELGEGVLYVHPDSVVGLRRECHAAYDERRLSLLGRLTLREEAWCVARIGLHRTARRLRGGRAEDLV